MCLYINGIFHPPHLLFWCATTSTDAAVAAAAHEAFYFERSVWNLIKEQATHNNDDIIFAYSSLQNYDNKMDFI